jgi:DNA-binding CsgD family transcriptional regulator
MGNRPTCEECEQKVEQLEKEVQDRKGVEDALKDYIAYQSVLAVLRGVGPEQTEEVLLQTFLSEIVKQYGFCMSWYGRYSSGEIRPILSAGRVDRYLDNLVLEIREPTSPDAQCAVSQAILKAAPFTYADLERDEGFRQWRDYALELGYRSNLALPLEVDGQVEGGMMVYADTPNAFPEERIQRLQLLAWEIGAILRGRRMRQGAEEALQRSRDELEIRAEERTAELSRSNALLKQEIAERKHAEEALRKREAELNAQSHHLEEVNTALKVLLKQREEDRTDLEENVLSNVKQLVTPHLQRLKKSRLDADQRALLSILESNLNNIVSPFASKLSSKFLGLTPMEIRAADLVKEGKTNKEIGEILCLSPNTVKFHRYNLRSKLGLKNRKKNLRSYLLSLQI